MEIIEKKWKDIEVGDTFQDNSKITQIHTTIPYNCYEINSLELFEKKKYKTIVSEDHILKINIAHTSKKIKKMVAQFCKKGTVDLEEDIEINSFLYLEENEKEAIKNFLKTGKDPLILNAENIGTDIESYEFTLPDEDLTKKVDVIINRKPVKFEAQIISKNELWLSIRGILYLKEIEPDIKLFSGNSFIGDIKPVGVKEAFCVSTDTGEYKTNGLIHHNSVSLRNIIFHCITHSNEIQIALVDLKLTEFSQFKGMNGVVAVCNSVREAAEVLRIGRKVMYSRNAEMSKIGLTDVADYKPHDPSDKIWISNREIQEDTIMKVKINGEEKEMTAKEILAYVEG